MTITASKGLFMSLVAAVHLTEHDLPIPAFTFGLVAACVFVLLMVAVWSYRDVAHRHAENSDPDAGQHYSGAGASHHGGHD